MTFKKSYSGRVACLPRRSPAKAGILDFGAPRAGVTPLSSRLRVFVVHVLPSSRKKGRKCETNPISFKTYYPPNTNNEKIPLSTKSKSYDCARRAGFQPRLVCARIRSILGRMPNKPAGKMPALLRPRHCKPLQTIANQCKAFSGKKNYLNSVDATQETRVARLCHLQSTINNELASEGYGRLRKGPPGVPADHRFNVSTIRPPVKED